tara:strand:- start:1401 stop:1670 length:270 start_codon:yes stop_codon:yes gene_type:complete
MRLKLSIVRNIAAAGTKVTCGVYDNSENPSEIIFLQVGLGGDKPTPKKDNIPSITITRDIPITASARTGIITFGRSSLNIIRKCDVPCV